MPPMPMGTCMFCSKELSGSDTGTAGHEECGNEFLRRKMDGKCTVCGERPAGGNDVEDNWCSECGYETPYSGYGN